MNKMRRFFAALSDLLSTAWKLDKLAVTAKLLEAFLGCASPFVSIILTEYVLNGIMAKKMFSSLLPGTFAALFAIFVLQAAKALNEKMSKTHTELCARRYHMMPGERSLTMDFPELDSPYTNQIRKNMEIERSWWGGMYGLLYIIFWFSFSVFNIVTASVLLSPVIHIKGFLDNWVTLVVFAAFFIGTIATTSTTMVFFKQRVKLYDMMNKAHTYYSFFINSGGVDYKAGKDIRIFDAGELIRDKIEGDNATLRSWKRKMTTIGLHAGSLYGSAAGFFQSASYLYVVIQALGGVVPVGSAIKYALLINSITLNINGLIRSITSLWEVVNRQNSSKDFLSIPDTMPRGKAPVEAPDGRYVFEFHNVSFRYPGADKYALRCLTMTIEAGKRMAVVGLNGSGKTTMIKLLCRLYDPTEGVITLNGRDIRELDREAYMQVFSVVFQDFKLHSFTLGQNIAASTQFDPTRAKKSLDLVGLSEWFKTLHQGLETPLYKDFLEDGIEISGGEAQKIALARALYKDAPVTVLDEPTAALDPIAEFEVYSRFNEMIGGKTAIYISHRLSSCRFCQDIAVFHEGTLAQRGSHDSLLSDKDGLYYSLWHAQAQHYEG